MRYSYGITAALLTGGAAIAQTAVPAVPVSDAPVISKDQLREDAQCRDKASATTTTPGRAGEASTMVKGNPNANPDAPTLNKTKAERKMEKEFKQADHQQAKQAAVMGQKGAQAGAEAGTPPNTPAGNPSVFKGGTPQ